MSGHSKWATTKHKKAIVDAKRGKLFAKLIKNIEVAAKMGGPDPTGNPTLYDAIQKAKKQSVPNDNIDSRGQARRRPEGGGVDYETIMYEVYGPPGVALLIECLTDNRNRAAMEVRTAVTRNGGTHGRPRLGLAALHPQGRRGRAEVAGGQGGHRGRRARGHPRRRRRGGQRPRRDASRSCPRPTDLVAVRTALQAAGIDYDSAEVQFVRAGHPGRARPGRRRQGVQAGRRRSRTSTTCRTSSPTSTSPTTSWSRRRVNAAAECDRACRTPAVSPEPTG